MVEHSGRRDQSLWKKTWLKRILVFSFHPQEDEMRVCGAANGILPSFFLLLLLLSLLRGPNFTIWQQWDFIFFLEPFLNSSLDSTREQARLRFILHSFVMSIYQVCRSFLKFISDRGETCIWEVHFIWTIAFVQFRLYDIWNKLILWSHTLITAQNNLFMNK